MFLWCQFGHIQLFGFNSNKAHCVKTTSKHSQCKVGALRQHSSDTNISRCSLETPGRGGANEYPQSMFLNQTKKTNAYPLKPNFPLYKVFFRGVHNMDMLKGMCEFEPNWLHRP